ncbi:MAG: hypothetical protein Q7S66_04990 [bacterium]|nr:hypothetical protein [bacterium]
MQSQTSKIVIAIVLTAVVVGGGVFLWQKNQQSAEVAQVKNVFNHELFSIQLPAPFTEKDGRITPVNAKDFPQIRFSIAESKSLLSSEQLLKNEEERQKNLREQTDAGGKIISTEKFSNTGIKFTTQHTGRTVEDATVGYINTFHYDISNANNILSFSASASDLENPEAVGKAFDEIMETLVLPQKTL